MRQPTLDFIPQLSDDQLEAIFKAFIDRRIERFRKRPQKTLAKAIELRTTKFRDSTLGKRRFIHPF